MANFDSCVAYVLGHEGGLSQNKSDPGGATNFGISLRFLREVDSDSLKRISIFGDVTEQTVVDLTKEQAEKIYYSEFWIKAPYDKIQNSIIGKYVFDMHVHHGLSMATKIAQRACSAAQKTKDFVKDDGLFGARTCQALNQASFMVIPPLISERSAFMRQLVALDKKLEVFLDGWISRAYDI